MDRVLVSRESLERLSSTWCKSSCGFSRLRPMEIDGQDRLSVLVMMPACRNNCEGHAYFSQLETLYPASLLFSPIKGIIEQVKNAIVIAALLWNIHLLFLYWV